MDRIIAVSGSVSPITGDQIAWAEAHGFTIIPVEALERQASTREPSLVPLRYGRMLTSPFAFFRGGAQLMAADLATVANTGLTVQLCGDAHLANFGVYAAPDRHLVFSLNDFDETLPGPFEWDVKRLAASLAVAARDNGLSDTRAVAAARAAFPGWAATPKADRLALLKKLYDVYKSRAEEMAQVGALAARWSMASVLILFAAGAILLHFVDEEKGKARAVML